MIDEIILAEFYSLGVCVGALLHVRGGGGLQDIRFLDFRLVVDRDKPGFRKYGLVTFHYLPLIHILLVSLNMFSLT